MSSFFPLLPPLASLTQPLLDQRTAVFFLLSVRYSHLLTSDYSLFCIALTGKRTVAGKQPRCIKKEWQEFNLLGNVEFHSSPQHSQGLILACEVQSPKWRQVCLWQMCYFTWDWCHCNLGGASIVALRCIKIFWEGCTRAVSQKWRPNQSLYLWNCEDMTFHLPLDWFPMWTHCSTNESICSWA